MVSGAPRMETFKPSSMPPKSQKQFMGTDIRGHRVAGGDRSDWSCFPRTSLTGSFPILSPNFSLAVPCPGSLLWLGAYSSLPPPSPGPPSISTHYKAPILLTMLWPLVHLGVPWARHHLVKELLPELKAGQVTQQRGHASVSFSGFQGAGL